MFICLLDQPNMCEKFLAYPDGEKKTIIDWIYAAKSDKTTERIVKSIQQISKNSK